MATTTYKVLGQVNPSATTATTLYTVPSATSTVISTITVCNQATAAITFRVAVRPAGATLAAAHYLVYDASLDANSMTALSLGISLATTDVITVYSSASTTSFSAFGAELS
jgi:hypothetical protein